MLGCSAPFHPCRLLTCPEWFYPWSTLAVTKLRGEKNDSKANGVQFPSSTLLPVQLFTGDATGPFCG